MTKSKFKNCWLVFASVIISFVCRAQNKYGFKEVEVPLYAVSNDVISYPTLHPIFAVSDDSQPDSSRHRLIFKIRLQPFQNIYSEYAKQKVGPEVLKRMYQIGRIQRKNYDTTKMSDKPLKGSICFLIELSKDGKILLRPDLNNDNNFNDDTVVVLNSINQNKIEKRTIKFNYTHIEMAGAERTVITVNPKIVFSIDEISDTTAEALVRNLKTRSGWISAVQDDYRMGNFKIDDHDYFILINAGIGGNIYDEISLNNISVFTNKDSVTKKGLFKSERYYLGDTLLLGNKYLVIKNISNLYETIRFQILPGTTKVLGFREGFFIPDFAGTELNGDTITYNNTLKNHYTILDFWGTWCEPCMELLPEMMTRYTALKVKFGDTLKLVSIAYDRKKDLDKLEKIIQANNMNWIHLYDDRDNYLTNPSSLVKLFQIGCYPGFILISPEGKVIMRGCGKEALEKIDAILHNIE